MTPRTPATTPVTGTPDVAPAGVAFAADQARLARRRRRVRLTVVAAATLSMTLASCSSSDDGKPASSSGSSASSKASGSAGASAPADGNRTQADTGLPTQAELDAATGDVSKLTTKQLAGQVIVGYYQGTSPQAAADAVRRNGLGGVIIMGDNVPSNPTDESAGLPAVTKAVQAAVKESGRSWPAVIGIDQEGGPVTRITSGVTPLPGAMAYGAADDAALATQLAKDEGQELRSLGVTMNFAPDADVTVGPSDPTIGVRSPSSDPQRVARAVNAQVAGYQQAGIVPVIKHFPGHGSVTTDTHVDYAVQAQSVEQLMKRDWVPFASASKAGVPAIMTAHIVVKDVDPNVPSTLSPKVLTGQLRDKLGFKGLIVTDGMNMGAIVKKFDRGGAAAVSALEAGADVVLMPADASASVSAIEKAVASGALTRQRLIESAARIVATTRHQHVSAPDASVRGSHDDDARRLAKASITQLGGRCGRDLVGSRVRVEGGTAEHRATLTKELKARGVDVGLQGTRVNLLEGGVYNAGESSAGGGAEATSPGTSGAIKAGNSGVQIALDTPYPLALRGSDTVGLAAYGSTQPTFAALADVLTGKAKAGGTLPVAVGKDGVGSSACR